MSVCLLELPYIFGVMPETTRIPLWKDIFFDMFRKMNPVMFTKGGTSVIAVEHVGEAIVGAAENGEHGKRYPVGDVNMTWKELIRIVLDAMGQPKKRIVTVPTFLAALYGKKMRADDAKQGKEAGLDHYRLFADIQSQFFYLDVETVVEALGYQRGGVKEAIIKTVKACYPELTKTIPIIAIPKLS
jgi:nucleoside-diphosphate-sugar epimerase